MTTSTSYTQKEIFNLIQHIQSESDLNEIKSLLVAYLFDKVVREAGKAFEDKNYSVEIFHKWKEEHFRKEIIIN